MVLEGNSILSTFMWASLESVLCEKWMQGDDLCVVISNIFHLEKNEFIIKKSTKVLNTKLGKFIKDQIDNGLSKELGKDHIGIFREVYRPKKRKNGKREGNTYAFYFTSQKGRKPPTYRDA